MHIKFFLQDGAVVNRILVIATANNVEIAHADGRLQALSAAS
jgi:hypothetical protein